MKDLSYRSIFLGHVSHDESLKDKIINKIIHIFMEEGEVSEKNFNKLDTISNFVKSNFTDLMFEFSKSQYESGKRIGYISEVLFDKEFSKLKFFNESILPFKSFINEGKIKKC